jgi:DNA-binding transcriptional ArsR family regulator
MNPVSVTDSLSNREEHVQALARLLGKGRKKELFGLIYGSQKRTWSVAEIANSLGLSPKKAGELAAVLASGHALIQEREGRNVFYRKVPAHRAIKDKVLRIAGNNRAVESIPTKRRPATSSPIFIMPSPRQRVRPPAPEARSGKAQCRVAFLMASPAGAGAINVGMDFREAKKAVLASAGSAKIALEPFLAADVNALLDALNEFKPHIIHFSGHGATNLVLFDSETVTEVGGTRLDFDVARDMLEATSNPPACLVLTACQTAERAAVFHTVVPVVVAMSGNISDFAAAFFSRRFYAALVAGESAANAFRQAKAFLKAEQLEDADLPTLIVRPGFEADKLTFVK